MNYVYHITSSIYNGYSYYGNLTSISLYDGLPLSLMLFFIGTNETNWHYLENLAMDLNSGSLDPTQTDRVISAPASYEEIAGVAYFECWMNGEFDFTDITGKISNGMSIAFDMSSGVLLGYRQKGRFDGKIEGKNVFCSTEFHIEQEDFDLREMSLYSELSSIENIVIISLLALPMIILYRRRNKDYK